MADVEKKREAWKKHFENVSKDEGQVAETVWAGIPERETAEWMGQEPGEDELEEALRKMKVGRAGGADEVVVEYLKYGGLTLREELFRIVRLMWNRAASAEDGEEAAEWPKEWRIALQVPL